MVATDVPVQAPAPVRRRRRPHASTVAACVVLAASVIAAAVIADGSRHGATAATVGPDRISVAAVTREVAALEGEPAYAAALRVATTPALVAPVAPNFVAPADGDPDDLRVSAGPPAGTRPLTRADLDAEVLTRLLYVTALHQELAASHVTPDAAEQVDGAEQARADAGTDAAGRSIFDRLPAWYRTELTDRAADVDALVRGLAGTSTVTDAEVAAAYQRQAPTRFTTVCLRSVVVDPSAAAAAAAALAADPSSGRDDGCATVGQWAVDVATKIAAAPVGATTTVARLGRTAVLTVTRRSTAPLTEVAGAVRAGLLARYTDLVNQAVDARLSLDRVSVAARYGTYQSGPGLHQVLPPDALTPASPPTTAPPGAPATSTTVPGQGHGQLDPFD